MINIQIDDTYSHQIDLQTVEQCANATLQSKWAVNPGACSIVITSDRELHVLNRQYRGIDAPTDVLSFGNEDIDPDSGALYIGDIIISYDRVLAQSIQAGHTPQTELQLLIVHGLLHLMGYDDEEHNARIKMWAAQKDILESLGVTPLGLPEE